MNTDQAAMGAIARAERFIPEAHIEWMARLPYVFCDKEQKLCFVHAGIEPDDFPEMDRNVALWTRSPRFFGVAGWADNKHLDGWMVVHGHTPTLAGVEYRSDGRRINVDTGACFGRPASRLTCARIEPGQRVTFISIDREGTLMFEPHVSAQADAEGERRGE